MLLTTLVVDTDFNDKGAEGATHRSETLRQKDCRNLLTLESDHHSDPPTGQRQGLYSLTLNLSGYGTEGRQLEVEPAAALFLWELKR